MSIANSPKPLPHNRVEYIRACPGFSLTRGGANFRPRRQRWHTGIRCVRQPHKVEDHKVEGLPDADRMGSCSVRSFSAQVIPANAEVTWGQGVQTLRH